MTRRQSPVEGRLSALKLALQTQTLETQMTALRAALSDAHYPVVALAAEEAGERLLYTLEPELCAAFQHFAEQPAAKDPQCIAKGAVARALVALDHPNADFYRRGMRLRQLEPVWGGHQDTATDVRVTCAVGLAATAYARALPELTLLLGDPEPRVRAGVTEAIACTEPIAAEAVLRTKALAGDPEPEVTGACFSALLRLAPDDSCTFVGSFLDHQDPTLQELAALALGDSRLDAALAELRARWDGAIYKGPAQMRLLRAAVLHRSTAAFAWLLGLIRTAERRLAEPLIRELAIYKGNARLREELQAVLKERAEPPLTASFEEHWRGD